MRISKLILLIFLLLLSCEKANPDTEFIKANYDKQDVQIPMRDGVKLYATVYTPKDKSVTYPFLIKRTPYSAGPYYDEFPDHLGPTGSNRFQEEKFIFVYQDVRGRFMSEGYFLNMTPACPHDDPKDNCVDESTDTYDTVEWLLNNIKNNNGKAGMWGISYPGFYAAASIINTHPALVASSPQAPIADWFIGDDFHHNGSFMLHDGFRFFSFFESPAKNPTDKWGDRPDFGSDDAYDFFLKLGPLSNANKNYFNHKIAFWDSMMNHPNYDEFWQRRNIIPHLKNITSSVMTVGGFFDAEDPYGAINIYREIEKNNPGITNTLVMGPWFHGGWVRSDGDFLNNVNFVNKTSVFYQENIDLPFFNYHLKGKGSSDLPEVMAYATGSNKWHKLENWPPNSSLQEQYYFADNNRLSNTQPENLDGADQYVSDPANPVPYTQEKTFSRTREYMVEDQRFVDGREDVMVYQSEVLTEDVTFAGPIIANLFVSTTGSDADFIVKVIDVFPDDEPEWQTEADKYMPNKLSGYHMMVRGESFRGRFRNSFETPEPFVPNEVTEVKMTMPDVFHTFKKGHRIKIHIQSSWFPLTDRNPQKYVPSIYEAKAEDFQKATITIHRSKQYPSNICVNEFVDMME